MDILNSILLLITGAAISAITNYINNLQNNSENKHLQIDNYLRTIKGEDIAIQFDQWSNLLLDFNKDSSISELTEVEANKMINTTFKYCSRDTVKRMANLQQFLYGNKKLDDDKHVILILIGGIIVSLKKDFTGETVSVKDLLRLKITDYENTKEVIGKIMDAYQYN